MKHKIQSVLFSVKKKSNSLVDVLRNTRGDQNSSTAGLAILAIVVVGLVVIWAKEYFPDFLTNIGDKINGLFDL